MGKINIYRLQSLWATLKCASWKKNNITTSCRIVDPRSSIVETQLISSPDSNVDSDRHKVFSMFGVMWKLKEFRRFSHFIIWIQDPGCTCFFYFYCLLFTIYNLLFRIALAIIWKYIWYYYCHSFLPDCQPLLLFRN